MASDNEEVKLHIDGQVFKMNKDLLCEYSDYFRAMFSGNYAEENQRDITIDVVDADSMDIILRYMKLGLIELSEHSLPTIANLAMAANFLQTTELIKQIKYCLDLQLSVSNWVEILIIAETASYDQLEYLASCFGLLAFKKMKPEYIPDIQRLFWYLSNPYLDADSELDVFKFGLEWIQQSETTPLADAALLILGCLDLSKITSEDSKTMSCLLKDCENSLAAKVVECMKMVLDKKQILQQTIISRNKSTLCESFTESVYRELFNMVKESKKRKLEYTAVASIWTYKDGKLDYIPHSAYIFKDQTRKVVLEKWMEVADKNLWGWSLAVWGPTKLLVMCGEHGRGTGQFMRDIKIYDTLRNEWTVYSAQLPKRRHAGIAICGDSLYVIGGIGGFRVIQEKAFVYDLKERTTRSIADFPHAMQSPAVCSHKGSVYAAGQKEIYVYEDLGKNDRWTSVISTDMQYNRIVSYKDHIYCSQNYFSNLYRFKPGVDKNIEMVTHFSAPTGAFCNVGNRLLVFTRPVCGGQLHELKVEEFLGCCDCTNETCPGPPKCGPKVLWSDKTSTFTVNDVAGAGALVLSMPKNLKPPISQYHQKYLSRYTNDIN